MCLFWNFAVTRSASFTNGWLAFSFCTDVLESRQNRLSYRTHQCQRSRVLWCMVMRVLGLIPDFLVMWVMPLLSWRKGIWRPWFSHFELLAEPCSYARKGFGQTNGICCLIQGTISTCLVWARGFKLQLVSVMWLASSNFPDIMKCPSSSIFSVEKLHFLRFSVSQLCVRVTVQYVHAIYPRLDFWKIW